MSSRTTVYSHELRVLACEGCGAPLSAAVTGGLATCSYCGAASRIAARDEREDRERASESGGASISESERMARLRDQASRDEALPESIAVLLVGGRLPGDAALGVLAAWKETRATLRERGEFLAAERLFHLTRLLLPHADDGARRALLETAVELLPDHRHRHVLRCELVMGAARLGELDAARAWLEMVEPRPLDLLMDSAVRAARATVAVARGSGADVLAELGEHPGDVPVATWYAETHGLLRLHGLEMMGRYEEAFRGLDAMVGKRGQAALVQAVAEMPMLLRRTRLVRLREDARSRRLTLHLSLLTAARTPVRAANVALVSAAIVVTLAFLAGLGKRAGWLTVRQIQTAWHELWYADTSLALEHGAPACGCVVSIVLLLFVTARQLPRALRARRRARALELELARAEAALADIEQRIAEMSPSPRRNTSRR